MRFDNGTTVREALRIIAEKSNLREADMNGLEEQYVLYKPKTQFEGTILENYSSYLTANDLTDNVRYLVNKFSPDLVINVALSNRMS